MEGPSKVEYAAMRKQLTDLKTANNGYLERARNAEESARDLQEQVYSLGDQTALLRTEIEVIQNQNLTEQTWLRMELEKARENREFWIGEAKRWAEMFGEARREYERGKPNPANRDLVMLALTGWLAFGFACVVLWVARTWL